jgi:hypothetical protein
MQYSKRVSDSNRPDAGNKNIGSPMLRLLRKLAAFALLAVPAVTLAGCSDSLMAGKSDTSFATSQKSYDKTLTPEQRKAAISDLQTEQAKRQAEATGDAAATAQPAQSQN